MGLLLVYISLWFYDNIYVSLACKPKQKVSNAFRNVIIFVISLHIILVPPVFVYARNTVVQDDRKLRNSKYLLMSAIQYNSIGFIDTCITMCIEESTQDVSQSVVLFVD
jgi:hypothetical protein